MNIKEKYPKGTKIKCIKLEDSFNPIPSGTVGSVEYVDDANQIHMNWENGSSLALIPELDEFEIIERKPKHKSKNESNAKNVKENIKRNTKTRERKRIQNTCKKEIG